MEFIIANIVGIAAGVALKILVPMPFLDDPMRKAWSWVYANTIGRL
jgi:hypothetical protein